MSESVARRTKAERDVVFKCLSALASQEIADDEIRRNVAEGRAMWCHPRDLRRLGFAAEAEALPLSAKAMYDELESGEVKAVTEPWVGFWQGVSDIVQRKFLGVLLSGAGGDFDYALALREINSEANRGLMFNADSSRIEKARPYARVVVGALAICLLVAATMVSVGRRRRVACAESASRESIGARLRPWAFLAPAVASIALWSYYPLLRGAVMAFQDYRIVGEAQWAGLDNFISVAIDPSFWQAWLRTLQYVGITLLVGFVTPVVLAVMLC
jgi:hypothetical protein